ncbi:MAG: amino-acid N-acetyltransferase [Porticoccaceae bacterium]|nr:amino-acid N-acetyltransferase [Porticoccaceae bacterium]
MIDHVKFFRETLPYINTHRGKTFVIAIGGDGVMHDNFPYVVQDIALLNSLGIRIVLVHGARPQIDEHLAKAQIAPRYEDNTRISDEPTMACVRDAMGNTRIGIEALLSMGLANSPMHGARLRVVSGNFITAKPLGVRNGVDFHHSGEVRRIDRTGIERQLEDGAIVLLSSLGYSTTGEAFNLTYEDVATQTAIALQAEKLVLFSAESGVPGPNGDLVRILSLPDVKQHLSPLREAGEQLLCNLLEAANLACLRGVPRAHIISYQKNGALLGELFTREGEGTLLLHDGNEVIRSATIEDIAGLLDLITPLEEAGVLVKRSRELLETEISRFTLVVDAENVVVACAALYPFTDHCSAELACVATHPDYRDRGLASRLLTQIEKQARSQGLTRLFVLTTRAAHWFQEHGFETASLDDLPAQKKELYNFQRNSKIFVKSLGIE